MPLLSANTTAESTCPQLERLCTVWQNWLSTIWPVYHQLRVENPSYPGPSTALPCYGDGRVTNHDRINGLLGDARFYAGKVYSRRLSEDRRLAAADNLRQKLEELMRLAAALADEMILGVKENLAPLHPDLPGFENAALILYRADSIQVQLVTMIRHLIGTLPSTSESSPACLENNGGQALLRGASAPPQIAGREQLIMGTSAPPTAANNRIWLQLVHGDLGRFFGAAIECTSTTWVCENLLWSSSGLQAPNAETFAGLIRKLETAHTMVLHTSCVSDAFNMVRSCNQAIQDIAEIAQRVHAQLGGGIPAGMRQRGIDLPRSREEMLAALAAIQQREAELPWMALRCHDSAVV